MPCNAHCVLSLTPPAHCNCKECEGHAHGTGSSQLRLILAPGPLVREPVDLVVAGATVHVSPATRETWEGALMLGWIAHLPGGRRWGLTPEEAARC
jgi:hypothetical protein